MPWARFPWPRSRDWPMVAVPAAPRCSSPSVTEQGPSRGRPRNWAGPGVRGRRSSSAARRAPESRTVPPSSRRSRPTVLGASSSSRRHPTARSSSLRPSVASSPTSHLKYPICPIQADMRSFGIPGWIRARRTRRESSSFAGAGCWWSRRRIQQLSWSSALLASHHWGSAPTGGWRRTRAGPWGRGRWSSWPWPPGTPIGSSPMRARTSATPMWAVVNSSSSVTRAARSL